MTPIETLTQLCEARKKGKHSPAFGSLAGSTDFPALLEHVKSLEAIVNALPKTEDGVPVVLGMNCVEIDDDGEINHEIGVCGINFEEGDAAFRVRNGDGHEWDCYEIYSTLAAAQAAKESK